MAAERRPIAIHLPGLGKEALGGGAERVAVTLATEFVRAGRAVDLVLSVVHPAPLSDLPPEVRIVDLRSRRLWTALPGLIAYRWRERPRVILSMMPLANVLNVLSGLMGPPGSRVAVLGEQNHRSIALSRDFDAEGTQLLHPLCRLAYPRSAAIIGCSDGVAGRIRNAYPILGSRCFGIPNPVSPSAMDPTGPAPHPWLKDRDVPCLVSIGRLHPQKDHRTLLRTIARVKEHRPVRALLLGDGPLRGEVEAEVRRLGLEDDVALLGYVADPRRYLAQADLLLHTASWEGLPVALLEALAEGTPVVATDCESGPREILDGGRYGCLAPVGDVEALAGAVIATLDSPRRPEFLQARANEFSPPEIARRYLEVLEAAAG